MLVRFKFFMWNKYLVNGEIYKCSIQRIELGLVVRLIMSIRPLKHQ